MAVVNPCVVSARLLEAFFLFSRLVEYSCGFVTREQLSSCVIGVGQPHSCAAIGRISPKPFPFPKLAFTRSLRSSQALPVFPLSIVEGVGQPANSTAFGSSDTLCGAAPALPRLSAAIGVGHGDKVEPLSDMRTAEARSAQIARPEGVVRAFHVSRYKIEPIERARNLLSKHDWRAALVNEPEPDGPEVARVGEAFLLSGGAEGLAGARAGPDGLVVGPSSAAQGVAPDADPGEEVTLVERMKVFRLNIMYAPLVHFAVGNVPCCDQIAQPRGCVWVVFIIVGPHSLSASIHASTSSFDHRQA